MPLAYFLVLYFLPCAASSFSTVICITDFGVVRCCLALKFCELMVSECSTCTAAREASSATAASCSREQRAAVCDVRRNVQKYIPWSGNKITILCQAEQKIPPLPQHPRLKNVFYLRNPTYLSAATINTKGVISHMPMMQPTEELSTSPPGSTRSEHMPLYPSCVCLPECSLSQAMATGALETRKKYVAKD